MRRLAIASVVGLLLAGVAPRSGPAITLDAAVELDPGQILGSSDGFNPGKSWQTDVPLVPPLDVAAGDTLEGTVSFGGRLLRLRDDGGGFFVVGMTEGFEQLIVSADDVGAPSSSSQVDAMARFTDVRGPVLETGGSRVGGVSDDGFFIQVVRHFVDPGQEILASGIRYRLRLTSGGPFSIDRVRLRVLAEVVDIVDRDPGDLAQRACWSGETQTGPSGTDACVLVDRHAAFGVESGLDNLRSVAVSPDGTSLYAVSGFDDAVVHFTRDPATGALTYVGCLTGETASGPVGSGACTPIPTATPTGAGSGLDAPQAVVVAPDGTSLYVAAASDDAVNWFSRDPGSGALTWMGCLTGNAQSNDDACTAIASATDGGAGSGLDGVRALAASPDATSLYAAAPGDDAVVHFDRDPATGALTFVGCFTGDALVSTACTRIPQASSDGPGSGLDEAWALALDAEGTSLYAVARLDDAVVRFGRDRQTGALTYGGCLTGDAGAGPDGTDACVALATATGGGAASGVDEPYAVAVTADGASVYVVAEGDDAITHFERDADTGALAFAACLTGEAETGPAGSGACAAIPAASAGGAESGLDKLRAVAVAPDDGSVYVTSPADDAVARFDRDHDTGALAYAGCLTGEAGTGPAGTAACDVVGSVQPNGAQSGLDNPQALTASADGLSVYTASGNDAAVMQFDRVPAPPPTTTTTTTTTTITTSTTATSTTSSTAPPATTTTSTTVAASTSTTATSTPTSSTTSTTLAAVPVAGASLVVTDGRNGGKRRLTLTITDPRADLTPAEGVDPTTTDVFVQVFGAGGSSDVACFRLPAAGWTLRTRRGKRTFVYEDRGAANGPCRRAAVKDGKVVTLSCRGTPQPLGYSLDEPAQGAIAVRFGVGTTTYCTRFGGTVTKDVSGRRFAARDAAAPAACDVPPAACP